MATFFADNAAKINAKIITADQRTSAICRDKEKTYNALANCDFVPKTFDKIDHFPVFIKPKQGQGAVGAKLIKSAADIPDVNLSEYVICEYLPGAEYTVDCLTDKNGKLRVASPRSRQRLMAGVSMAGETEALTPEIQHIANEINQRLSFNGLWWFQIKQNSAGKWKLLEISTRGAGTMALTRARGLNLPLLSVYNAMDYDISIEPNNYHVKMDSSLVRRYKIDYEYDTVYFDFDDTLIIRNKVNLKAIWFLYQCRNMGKKIILLTKHEQELAETMARFRIAPELFDEIVHIRPDSHKSEYILPDHAIFIDNAYAERHDVQLCHNIPVFDVDGLDVLMDWRF